MDSTPLGEVNISRFKEIEHITPAKWRQKSKRQW